MGLEKKFRQIVFMEDLDRGVCLARLCDMATGRESLPASPVKLEAASPEEFKARVPGLHFKWGMAPGPFGFCSIGWSHRGICHLAFHEALGVTPEGLFAKWPHAEFQRDEGEARRLVSMVFRRDPNTGGALSVFVRATPFQLRVWSALLRIPEGRVASYRAIARAVGKPAAARAVGAACGANPVAFLIPCHRVIRDTGAIQGYRWGDERKRALLAWEFARTGRRMPCHKKFG